MSKAEVLVKQTSQSLMAAYREMAAEPERETEAEQWCEGLIGNAIDFHLEGMKEHEIPDRLRTKKS